jgi:hypothetical protein
MKGHCKVCNKLFTGSNFVDWITKLEEHYINEHPSDYRNWKLKSIKARKEAIKKHKVKKRK